MLPIAHLFEIGKPNIVANHIDCSVPRAEGGRCNLYMPRNANIIAAIKVPGRCALRLPILINITDFYVPGSKAGRCVASDRKPKTKVCQIYSWCPVEIDELPMSGFNIRYCVAIL